MNKSYNSNDRSSMQKELIGMYYRWLKASEPIKACSAGMLAGAALLAYRCGAIDTKLYQEIAAKIQGYSS